MAALEWTGARVFGFIALALALTLPVAAFANLSLLLFGPKDWPSTLALVREEFPQVEQMSTAELAEHTTLRARNPLLVDTRTRAEYDVSHLAGAVHIESAAELEKAAKTAADRGIVVYCSVGYRSSALATKARARGVTNIVNLEGSIFKWANEGRPLEQNGKPVTTVHPYNAKWAKLLNAPYRSAY